METYEKNKIFFTRIKMQVTNLNGLIYAQRYAAPKKRATKVNLELINSTVKYDKKTKQFWRESLYYDYQLNWFTISDRLDPHEQSYNKLSRAISMNKRLLLKQ
jgi:hypothetical protein